MNTTKRCTFTDLSSLALGGGLAMISGAQTRTPSVAISGPNALISQLVFNVTEESLANYTFNVVPDRDPVPRYANSIYFNHKNDDILIFISITKMMI